MNVAARHVVSARCAGALSNLQLACLVCQPPVEESHCSSSSISQPSCASKKSCTIVQQLLQRHFLLKHLRQIRRQRQTPCDSCGLYVAACLMGAGSHGQWCMDTRCNVCCSSETYLPTVRYTLSFAQSLHLHVWLCWANGVEKLPSNNNSCALYTDR